MISVADLLVARRERKVVMSDRLGEGSCAVDFLCSESSCSVGGVVRKLSASGVGEEEGLRLRSSLEVVGRVWSPMVDMVVEMCCWEEVKIWLSAKSIVLGDIVVGRRCEQGGCC